MTETAKQGTSAGPMRVPATAGEAMRPALTVADPNDHAAAAAYLMKHAGVTALVVIDDEEARRPIGLITEADIVQAVADNKDLNDIRILALMTSNPTVVRARTDLREAARTMIAGHFRHLPVVGGNGRLIGMLDILDLGSALLEASAR
jgi:CBS domain-containing protein